MIAEKFVPGVLGVLTFLGAEFGLRISFLTKDWGNRLLDRILQTSIAGTAFWGVMVTLLIGMDSMVVVARLKKMGYHSTIVRYFLESLYAFSAVLVFSIVMEPLSKILPELTLTSLWLASCAWAIATTIRTFIILKAILLRVGQA